LLSVGVQSPVIQAVCHVPLATLVLCSFRMLTLNVRIPVKANDLSLPLKFWIASCTR
jgi:hypothetical protein